VRVLATTHFEELKGIAYEDGRFENGSMTFDEERLRPTYRLRLGVPGRSMGITIARALGLPEEVLERAGRYLAGAGHELASALERLEAERERARADSARAEDARREAEGVRLRLAAERDRAREEESRILAGARQKAREEIRKAEGQLRAVTEELRKEKKIETVRKAQAVIREWKEKGAAAEEDPAVRAMISRTAPLPPGAALFQGQKVFLSTIHKEGEVGSVPAPDDREVEVVVGGMKLRVRKDQVRIFPAAGPRTAEGKAQKPHRRGEEAAPALYLQTPENTLDLRGRYVDDALPEVEAFLDRLSLAQAPHAFIIHGHGTGALKAAVRGHLRNSPYVKRAVAAPREQGGDGVTIVLLH
jgi:DNA mismatch repair protein MutS2